MRKTLILFVLLVGACGQEPVEEPADPESCTVTEVDGGAEISCPDGTSAFIPKGEDGEDGAAGEDGEDGRSPEACSVAPVDGGVMFTCPDGSNGFVPDGADGETPSVSTLPEQPGPNCTYGGIAILVDDAVVDYVCDGKGFPECGVVAGDVTITSGLDLVALGDCEGVDGNLIINNVDSLAFLSSLTLVTGNLTIANTALTNLNGLEALDTVGGTLRINMNPDLSSLMGFLPSTMGGSLFISDNPVLSTCAVDDFLTAVSTGGQTTSNVNNGPCN